MKITNDNTENPTQVTPHILNENDNILNHILENLQEFDLKQYADKERSRINNAEIEEEVSEIDDEGTSEPTEENSDAIELNNLQLKLNQREYKIVAVKALRAETSKLGHPFAHFNDSIQVYTGKRWMKVTDEELGTFLMKATEKLGVPKLISNDADFVNKCKKQLPLFSHVNVNEMKSMDVINFDNVTLHLNGEKFEYRDHNPEDYLSYVLPYKYDPKATCPKFQEFLDRVIPEKDKQLILAEFFGSVFSKIKHEKVLILYGNGANGKSVVLLIITSVLGEVNVSSSTLESLTDSNGYYRGILDNSLLNYSGEISKK